LAVAVGLVSVVPEMEGASGKSSFKAIATSRV